MKNTECNEIDRNIYYSENPEFIRLEGFHTVLNDYIDENLNRFILNKFKHMWE